MSNKEEAVKAQILRQECDVLRETKIKLNTEIRNIVREKEDMYEQVQELNNTLEQSKKELDEAKKELNDKIKLRNDLDESIRNDRNIIKDEFERLDKEKEDISNQQKKLLIAIEAHKETYNRTEKKCKELDGKLSKINEILNVCQ